MSPHYIGMEPNLTVDLDALATRLEATRSKMQRMHVELELKSLLIKELEAAMGLQADMLLRLSNRMQQPRGKPRRLRLVS
jgi:hypothetical protein